MEFCVLMHTVLALNDHTKHMFEGVIETSVDFGFQFLMGHLLFLALSSVERFVVEDLLPYTGISTSNRLW